MLALETTATISNHRLVIQDQALPANTAQARVIILWNAPVVQPRRTPPSALAGMGEEHCNLLNISTEQDWETIKS